MAKSKTIMIRNINDQTQKNLNIIMNDYRIRTASKAFVFSINELAELKESNKRLRIELLNARESLKRIETSTYTLKTSLKTLLNI